MTKKKTVKVNLNSKRLHDIRMARRRELMERAADTMPDKAWAYMLGFDDDYDPVFGGRDDFERTGDD